MLKRSWCGILAFVAMVTTGAVTAAAQDIVLYPSDVTSSSGNWYVSASSSGAGGQRETSNDYGWSSPNAPLASPGDYYEATFTAPSYTTYHVWIRLRATSDSKWNDSVWVQFSDAMDSNGSAAYRTGTSSALLMNLEQCNGCGVSGWGWTDKAYWQSQNPLIMFGARGTHTVRIQTREDGVQVDQIVLSPVNYMTRAPGQTSNDATILPHSTDGGTGAASLSTSSGAPSPYLGSAVSLPGSINAQDFDNGGEGVSYHDTSSGNSGGAYRGGDVDLEPSTDGGNDVGWTASGEWLNYSVNVTASGTYTVQLRVASPSGNGGLHVGFNKSGVWSAVSIPATGGWQSWTTVSVPVTLTAGSQILTLGFDSGGFNINRISVISGGSGSTTAASGGSATPTPFGGKAWALPGTIQAEDFDDGGEGVAYHDTTSGNSGGAYRSTGVDIEASSAVGYDVGWTSATEYLNYTVNVASAGSYTVQLRVASAGGGSMHVGFNGSGVWAAVPVSATGGWQSWTTINVPVTLAAGRQLMTLMVDSGGVNLDKVTVASGSTGTSGGGTSYTASGSFRMMTWNIQHATTAYGAYDITSQAQFIASQKPDVVALQEVETWDENQPQRYRQLLEQYTGNPWTVVWAPVTNASSTEGNVILTRLPVVAQNTYQLHATSDYSLLYANRSVAQATVRVGGVDVNVFSTHLDYYSTSYRTTQEQQLMSWALNFGGPRLVGGDFNSWWGEWWITNMQTQYTDTWQDYTGSNQNGYTVNNAVRFDYIFRSMDGGWRATPTNAYVPVTSLSDHNPVVADFKVQ